MVMTDANKGLRLHHVFSLERVMAVNVIQVNVIHLAM